MQENTDYKKHGDAAFRAKDFETAIEFYTEVSIVNNQETLIYIIFFIKITK